MAEPDVTYEIHEPVKGEMDSSLHLKPLLCERCTRHIAATERFVVRSSDKAVFCQGCGDIVIGLHRPERLYGKSSLDPVSEERELRLAQRLAETTVVIWAEEARALLHEMDWSAVRTGTEGRSGEVPVVFKACPLCRGVKSDQGRFVADGYWHPDEIGHTLTCRLAALLKEDDS